MAVAVERGFGVALHIHIGFDLRFQVPAPTAAMLLVHAYPFRYHFPQPETLTIAPGVRSDTFRDLHGNSCTRLLAPAGLLTLTSHGVVEVDGLPDSVDSFVGQHLLHELPVETLPFLFSSRYCEVDRLSEFAWATFGQGPTGYLRVQAICDYVHRHIRFDYAHASPFKTAHDAFTCRQGVCRDFAHLAITLCRCMGIPARYATGYLGDIGVPNNPAPMDFSAWFEVYLGNRWYTFDARHNAPRIGRIVMAYGRDATDAALTSSFGPMILQHFTVWTEAL
jgi:transglutaminase-like putative cysteine protease